MKKRSLGVMLVVAIVLVLSLAVVASASAAPYLTSVSPTSAANTTYSSTQLKVYGQNLTDFIGDPEVTLYQRAWPYDYISGTDVFVVGMFGGLAGAVYAYSKGSISPDVMSIARSVDGLVMVLLGGVQTLSGPVVGAVVFTWLQDTIARNTDYWRALLGMTIIVLVLAFPQGIVGFIRSRFTRREDA